MRIVLTFPESLGAPGGGAVGVLAIARHLEAAGAEVTLLHAARGPGAPAVPAWTRAVPASRLHYLLDASAMRRAVRAIVRDRPVDAIVGWGTVSSLLPEVARAAGATFAVVAAKPSYEAWRDRKTSFRTIKRWSDRATTIRQLRVADVVYALSSYARDELVSLFDLDPRAVTVAYWGVDEAFTAIERAPQPRVTRLLFAGTLAPHKGVHDAVRALGLVPDRSLHLRIAGWGDADAVRDTAARAGVLDRVTMLGRLDRPALVDELAAADLAVLPSRQESFGLAIAEAQAAGVPVVSYAAGSVPEVVDDGVTGWLAPPGDVEALARAITAAAADPAEAGRRGAAGRARVVERFSWARTATTMLAAIERSRGTVTV